MGEKGAVVLTRKIGEKILIGGGIMIEVKEIRRNQVRILVVAPRETSIMRSEIVEQQQRGDEEQRGDK